MYEPRRASRGSAPPPSVEPPAAVAHAPIAGPAPTRLHSLSALACSKVPTVQLRVADNHTAPSGPVLQRAFTVSANVTAAKEQTYPIERLSVESIDMPQDDRPDTQFGAEQKSHAVAWVLQFRYWQAYFTGTYADVRAKLIAMARADQASDTNAPSTQLRAQAVALLDVPADAQLALSEWTSRMNRAISLYVQAYQASSFAAYNQKPKGRGEGDAMAKLSAADQQLASAAEAQALGEPPGATPLQRDVIAQANKLIDVSFRLDPGVFLKAYDDWLKVVAGLNPALGEKFAAALAATVAAKPLSPAIAAKFRVKTLGELLQAWKAAPGTQSRDVPAPTVAAGAGMSFTVAAKVTASKETAYPLDQVTVDDISLSEGDRPDTQFGATQLSHAVAWTGKIDEWKLLFRGPLRTVLQRLYDAAASDQHHDLNPASRAQRARLSALSEHLKGNASAPLSTWRGLLNGAVTLYVNVYQLASFTTHTDKAQSHGEPQAKKYLSELEAHLAKGGPAPAADGVVQRMRWFIDAPMDKDLTLVVRANLMWRQMLATTYPIVMGAYAKAVDTALAAIKLPAPYEKATNMFEAINAMAAKKPDDFAMKMGEMSAPPPRAADYGYPITGEQAAYLATNRLRVRYVNPDGDCLYNGTIVGGVAESVRQLRTRVATKLEETDAAAATLVREGGWNGTHGDRAPGILAAQLGLTYIIVHPNAAVEQVGNGARIIYLLIVANPMQHYHAALPM